MKVHRVTANEYFHTQKSGLHTTIDLRTPAEYENEYLDGCLSLPVQELDKKSFEHLIDMAKHTEGPIYLLCQSGARADMAVNKLKDATDHELIIIQGGLNALKETGIITLSGSRKTMSLERQVRIAAGALTVIGAFLAVTVNISFIALSAFVGAGLMFAGITDTCGMGMILARMPWNKASTA